MTCIRSSEHGSVKPRSRAPTRELHSNKLSVSQTRTSVRSACEAEIQEEYARQHEMQRGDTCQCMDDAEHSLFLEPCNVRA